MSFFTELERTLSRQRLDSYRLQGGGDQKALCRYLWNVSLCEALYPVLQILEVAARNALHGEISVACGHAEWLKNETGFLKPPEIGRIQGAKGNLMKLGRACTEPLLIAELSFGFWTSLFDSRYDKMWPKIIAQVFPNMPRTIRTRGEVSPRMNQVRKLRNAALHHHSIWHWGDLQKQHHDIHTLIHWVCASSSKMAVALDRFPTVYAGGPDQFEKTAGAISV